jgi:hypothetical protein
LEKSGFKAGDNLDKIVSPGKIILTKAQERSEKSMEYKTKNWINFCKRLRKEIEGVYNWAFQKREFG